MKVANRCYLKSLVGALNTVSDLEQESIGSPNDEVAIRGIIRTHVVPVYEAYSDDSRSQCRDSLAYFLSKGDISFGDLIDQQQEWECGSPDDPRDLFLWIWRELFGADGYRVDVTDNWEVREDWSAI